MSVSRTLARTFAVKASKSTKKPSQPVTSLDQTEKMLLEVLRPMPRSPPRSDEERKHLRALMIRYGKLKWQHHIELEKRKREFLRAKWSAVDALPHQRKLEALYTQSTPFPLNRPIFTDTPPIKGFNAGDLAKKS